MRVLVVIFFLSSLYLHAQDVGVVAEKDRYDLEYYMKTALTSKQIANIGSVVLARVKILQKKSERSKAENLILLKDAQLLGQVYNTMQDKNKKKEFISVLIAVRDEFIAYLAKNKRDYEIKTELAFLVHMAFLAYVDTKDYYRSVRIMQEIAADVYNWKPNAKVALVLGQIYIGANKAGLPLMANTLAERYLEEAITLDGGSGYITYLATIYFSNLYFKTRRMNDAMMYMAEAKALYPDGAFAYIVEYLFFAHGKSLF